MDLEKALWSVGGALAGFAGGILTKLLTLVIPSYTELVRENQALRERVEELESELGDVELKSRLDFHPEERQG